MMNRTAALLLLLGSAPAWAQDSVGEDERKNRSDSSRDTTTTFSQGAGVLAGDGILRATGPISYTRARMVNELEMGSLKLKAPVSLGHRQTFGFALSELKADAGVGGTVDMGKVELKGGGDLGYTWRPGWLDPYQPLPDGTLAATNRRSFAQGELNAGLELKPAKRHWVQLDYALAFADYTEDPNFDPIASPTHLMPGDHTAHRVDASWHTRKAPYRVEAGLDFERRAYTDQYARDAGTGATHAGAGGAPPNPLYTKWTMEPYAKGRYALKDTPWTLRAGYGLEVQKDVFQGYYSYTGHHPELGVDFETEAIEVQWRAEANLRRYGPNSYAVGGSHPALLYGDRRVERRVDTSVEVAYPLGDKLAVVVDADILVRRTNFPTYEPGVYPAGSQYDIDWNYTNALVLAGVRYER